MAAESGSPFDRSTASSASALIPAVASNGPTQTRTNATVARHRSCRASSLQVVREESGEMTQSLCGWGMWLLGAHHPQVPDTCVVPRLGVGLEKL